MLQELLVALSPCEDDINPYPHSLSGRGHQEVSPIVGFHTECQLVVGAFHSPQVIHVHLFYRLEVNPTSGFPFTFVRVVEQGAFYSVKHEPTLVPGFKLIAHFLQEASTIRRSEYNVRTALYMVTCRLYVNLQVKVFVPDW